MRIGPHAIYIEKTDVAKNMARFYALSIEPTLFGEISLIRRWGRIGTYGQTRTMCFTAEDDAVKQFDRIEREKTRRGYRERPIPNDQTTVNFVQDGDRHARYDLAPRPTDKAGDRGASRQTSPGCACRCADR